MYAPSGRKPPTVEIGPATPLYQPAMYQPAVWGTIEMGMSLASLTAAIQTHIDPDMETMTAEGMAEHALGFFGFYDRIIDNALEPTDRNLFYMFQDYDLLTTESEETTLWDGREWRIHYWKFKPEALNALEKPKKELSNDDPYAGVYSDVPDGLWRTLSDDDYEEPLFGH